MHAYNILRRKRIFAIERSPFWSQFLSPLRRKRAILTRRPRDISADCDVIEIGRFSGKSTRLYRLLNKDNDGCWSHARDKSRLKSASSLQRCRETLITLLRFYSTEYLIFNVGNIRDKIPNFCWEKKIDRWCDLLRNLQQLIQ